jgi:hypothetical protein
LRHGNGWQLPGRALALRDVCAVVTGKGRQNHDLLVLRGECIARGNGETKRAEGVRELVSF